jgi:hypothetical protein
VVIQFVLRALRLAVRPLPRRSTASFHHRDRHAFHTPSRRATVSGRMVLTPVFPFAVGTQLGRPTWLSRTEGDVLPRCFALANCQWQWLFPGWFLGGLARFKCGAPQFALATCSTTPRARRLCTVTRKQPGTPPRDHSSPGVAHGRDKQTNRLERPCCWEPSHSGPTAAAVTAPSMARGQGKPYGGYEARKLRLW